MKKKEEQKIIRKQVSKKLKAIKELTSMACGVSSWSSYIRSALGMSVTQLAEKLHVSQSSISELEKREREGSITLKKLKDLANAMDCDVAYAFIPRTSIEETVHSQARKKAIEGITASNTHMALEDQLVEADLEERIEDLSEDLIYSKYLWDTNE